MENTDKASPYSSPRLVLRFSDIRSGLQRTSLSASFSEPNSPSGMCLNNISKTLCTPSPQTRHLQRKVDITPKSETKRRVDLGTPNFKSQSLTDTPNLPIFRKLNINDRSRRKAKIGRCLALSFPDSDANSTSSQDSLDVSDSHTERPRESVANSEQEMEFKRPAPPLERGQSTPKKIPRSENPRRRWNLQAEPFQDPKESVNKHLDFDPDCDLCCASISTNAPESPGNCDLCVSGNSVFFNPIKQEKLSSPRPLTIPQFTQIHERPTRVPQSDPFYPFYIPENTNTQQEIRNEASTEAPKEALREASFSLDNLPCLFCVSEIAPVTVEMPHPTSVNPTPKSLKKPSCSCPDFCN